MCHVSSLWKGPGINRCQMTNLISFAVANNSSDKDRMKRSFFSIISYGWCSFINLNSDGICRHIYWFHISLQRSLIMHEYGISDIFQLFYFPPYFSNSRQFWTRPGVILFGNGTYHWSTKWILVYAKKIWTGVGAVYVPIWGQINISSDYGLWTVRRQATTWTYDRWLLARPIGTNLCGIVMKIW